VRRDLKNCRANFTMPCPIPDNGRRTKTVGMRWPPNGSPAPVSPDAESAKLYPSKRIESDPPVVMTEQGDKAPQALLRWAAPLTSMMPLFSALDDLQAQADMANLARLSGSDPGGATQSVKTKSHLYISQGRSTLEHTWLQPALRRKGLQHVLFTAEDHGLVVPSWLREAPDPNALNKAVEQEDWQRRLSQPVSVRRVWGATGLLWALLLDRFEAQLSFQVCQHCGRIISGKAGKRFCGPDDSSQCFNARRAVDQRRSRSGRKSKIQTSSR
jgi:hypothetical protein